MNLVHTAQIAVTLAVGFALGSTMTASVHAQSGPTMPAPPPTAPGPAIPGSGTSTSRPWQLKNKEKIHYLDLLGIQSSDDAKEILVRNRPDAINVVDAGTVGNLGAMLIGGAVQFGTGSTIYDFKPQALDGDARIVADLGVALRKLMKPADWTRFRADEQRGSSTDAALILGRADQLAKVALTLKSL